MFQSLLEASLDVSEMPLSLGTETAFGENLQLVQFSLRISSSYLFPILSSAFLRSDAHLLSPSTDNTCPAFTRSSVQTEGFDNKLSLFSVNVSHFFL